MSDIKLFKVGSGVVFEIEGRSASVEKSLQKQMEAHLEAFLGVRFVASEYSTGKKHGGRIDTLGLDEDGSPVIIEYKRAMNENVINQGLFYLDWLMDHKAEFTLVVMKQFGKQAADAIEWSSPRLLCIAGEFTKYDQYAVEQINRNIELIRYRRYGDDLLLFELVNATTAQAQPASPPANNGDSKKTGKTVTDYLSQADQKLVDLFEELKAFIMALGDDIQVKTLKNYFAFKRFQNFACVEVHPQTGRLLVYTKIDPDDIEIEESFTRDVRKIGHLGTGDLEIRIASETDLEKAKPLIVQSYEIS
jgi:predicted transport protein